MIYAAVGQASSVDCERAVSSCVDHTGLGRPGDVADAAAAAVATCHAVSTVDSFCFVATESEASIGVVMPLMTVTNCYYYYC